MTFWLSADACPVLDRMFQFSMSLHEPNGKLPGYNGLQMVRCIHPLRMKSEWIALGPNHTVYVIT